MTLEKDYKIRLEENLGPNGSDITDPVDVVSKKALVESKNQIDKVTHTPSLL